MATSYSGPSYAPSSNSGFVPGHHPSSSSVSSLSSFAPSPFGHSPHPSLGGAPPIPSPYAAPTTNHTRILLLSAFNPSLKTKDLQEALAEWQDEPGGLKVKWRDDTSAWVVFGEAAVAKRAFLTLVTTPPPLLQPSTVEPYTGSDVQSILSAVANRPRSRSLAGQGSVSGPAGGHSRKGSLLGSGGGSALGAAIASAQAAGPHGAATASATSPSSGVSPVPVSASHGHARTGSWQRSSISSPLSGIPRANGGAGSPVDAFEGGRASPDTLAGGAAGNGVIAGEAPRRYGTGPINGGGHARRESRSGSDHVAASVAGLTINE